MRFLTIERLVMSVARDKNPAPAKKMPSCLRDRSDVMGDLVSGRVFGVGTAAGTPDAGTDFGNCSLMLATAAVVGIVFSEADAAD